MGAQVSADAFGALRLEGRVAVVTGAGSGIGRSTAALMAGRGAHVVVADRDALAAEETVAAITGAGATATTHVFDLADPDAAAGLVSTVLEATGRLDILHNNAAYISASDDEVVGLALRVWDRTMEVNARGAMALSAAALEVMLAAGGGSIVNTSSIGALVAEADRPAYAASKAAVGALTRSIATRYGRRGIRCNQVLPGLTLTPAVTGNLGSAELAAYERHNLTPLATSDDVAEVVAFLASDAARGITGATVLVDGGASVHLSPVADQLGW